MNLIQEYGGYDKAKAASKRIDVLSLRYRQLKAELLQYRREHEMYEAGDWIIIDSYKPEFQFHRLTADDMGSHWINLVEFRHATDAEIKAQCRLDDDSMRDEGRDITSELNGDKVD